MRIKFAFGFLTFRTSPKIHTEFTGYGIVVDAFMLDKRNLSQLANGWNSIGKALTILSYSYGLTLKHESSKSPLGPFKKRTGSTNARGITSVDSNH